MPCQYSKNLVYLNPIVKKIIIVFIILFSSIIELAAQSQFNPDSELLQAANLGENMSDSEFMYYALYVSDVPKEAIPSYLQKYSSLAQNLHRDILSKNITDDFKIAEYILTFLHNTQFKSYQETVTNLNVLFDRGIYNCVSSSVLFYALSMRYSLQVGGVKTHDHSFCTISSNGKTIDVETTTIYGFNPGEKKEFANSFGQTGFVYTPPSNYTNRTSIGKLDMLSLIIQNNIVELQKQRKFNQTIYLAIDMYTLLQDSHSLTTLLNEFGNYTSYMSINKRFEEGIQFLSEAHSIYGNTQHFQSLVTLLYHNAMVTLIGSGQEQVIRKNLPTAQKLSDTYSLNSLVSQETRNEMSELLTYATLITFVHENSFTISVDKVKSFSSQNLITEKIRNDLLLNIFSSELKHLLDSKNWTEALIVANTAVVDMSNDARAITQLNNVEHNIATYFHNQFAAYFNAKNYGQAKKILEEGLSFVPKSRVLLSDVRTLDSVY